MDIWAILLDTAILALLILSALFAYFRGFAREILSLLVLALSVAAGYWGYFNLGASMEGILGTKIYAQFVDAFLAFLVIYIALSIAASALYKIISLSPMRSLDMTLGLFFGIVRMMLILTVVYMILEIITENDVYASLPSEVSDSISLPVFDMLAEILADKSENVLAAIEGWIGQNASDGAQ